MKIKSDPRTELGIKSKYKLDLSKHYSKYNKDIINSIGHVFDYINKMVKLLNNEKITLA